MPGSKLHSTVQWKGTAQSPSSCSFMSVAVVFLHWGWRLLTALPQCFHWSQLRYYVNKAQSSSSSVLQCWFSCSDRCSAVLFQRESFLEVTGVKLISELIRGRNRVRRNTFVQQLPKLSFLVTGKCGWRKIATHKHNIQAGWLLQKREWWFCFYSRVPAALLQPKDSFLSSLGFSDCPLPCTLYNICSRVCSFALSSHGIGHNG